MKYLKKFINFINEGAWYEETPAGDKVYLSVRNNPNRQTELLKTVDSNMQNYNIKRLAGFKVYYGLYPVEKFYSYEKHQDPKETRRLKREKEEREGIMKDRIMDHLKGYRDKKYTMAQGEKLSEFLNYTFAKNIKGEINYIVRMGSSEKLVDELAQSFKELYPNANIIDIGKLEYFSAEDAVNWEEYNKKVENELAKPRYDAKGNPLPEHSRTRDLVTEWIEKIKKEIKNKIEKGEKPSFNIKSSGLEGGVRSALRPKYDTASEEFINAVHHCVFGDAEGIFGKMVIVDDNVNQGVDFRDISHKILEILGGIIDVTKNVTAGSLKGLEIFKKISDSYKLKRTENQIKSDLDDLLEIDAKERISNNIMGYVLYGFQTERQEPVRADYEDLIISMGRSVVTEKGIRGGRNTIYRSSYDEIFNEIEKRGVEILKDIIPESDAELRRRVNQVLNANYGNIISGRAVVPDPTEVKYPFAESWKIGDVLVTSDGKHKAEIADINPFEGTLQMRVITGPFTGKLIGMDLGKLDPQMPSAPWKWYGDGK